MFSQARIVQLTKVNESMGEEIKLLQSMVSATIMSGDSGIVMSGDIVVSASYV